MNKTWYAHAKTEIELDKKYLPNKLMVAVQDIYNMALSKMCDPFGLLKG